MKRRIIISLAIILMSATFCSAKTDIDKFKVFTKEHPLRVLCDWNFPPYEYLDDNGEPAGFNVEVVDRILSLMNVPHQFIMQDFEKAIKMYDNKDFDLSISARRPDKDKGLSYGNVTLGFYNICIIHRKDMNFYPSLKDLEDNMIYVQKGDISEDLVKKTYPSQNVIGMNDMHLALRDVSVGKVKYMVWIKEPSRWFIHKYSFSNLTISDANIPMQGIFFISPHKWITESMDESLASMQQNGETDYLHAKWFNHQNKQKDNSYIVLFVLLFLAIAVVALLGFNHVLKNRIKKARKQSEDLFRMRTMALKLDKSNLLVFKPEDLREEGNTWDPTRVHPDNKDFIDDVWKIAKGELHSLEKTIRYNIGQEDKPVWRYYGTTAIAEKKKEKITNVIMTWKDVTEEINERNRYKEMSDKYLTIFNSALIGLSFYDKNGFLVNSNEQMCQIFHTEDMKNDIGKYNILKSHIGEFIMDGTTVHSSYFTRHVTTHGLDSYLELQVEPVKDDNNELIYIIVSAKDVTYERQLQLNLLENTNKYKKTEKSLLRYSEMLKYVLDLSKTRIWIADFESKTIKYSKDMKTYEHTFTFEEYINALSDKDRDLITDILKADNKDKPKFVNIVQHITHNLYDKEKWISVTAVPVYDNQKNLTGYRGLMHDVTELMQTQNRLKEETLNAEKSDQTKSLFLANMSHEIRTPLNSIVGFSELLEGLGKDERNEFLRIIDKNCDMLLRLINDILELSDMDTNLQTLVSEDVDWAVNFNEICTSLEQRVTSPDIKYMIVNPYKTFNTCLDANRLNQVITNFVTNAVKYTRKGYIKVGYEYKEQGLYIYCEDTGSGIPDDKKEKIFERFVKLDDFVQGTGLGLSICKTIADRYHGRIGVDSKEGEGSTFWIWIPCKYAEEK